MNENNKVAKSITKDDLKSFMQKLAILEDEIAEKLENKKIADEALKKTPEYYIVQVNEGELKSLQQEEAEFKTDLKVLIWSLASENEFVDRKPVDGVEIKEFETVNIKDEKKAKAWATTNMPNALSLKTSELNKVIKGGLEVDWAIIDHEFRVQIASDLSGYLPKEE